MNCLEFRRAFGADPQHEDEALRAHRMECLACQRFAQETLRLEGLIKRALEVPVSAAVTQKTEVRAARPRWYAMAASILLTIGIGAFWFFISPRDSLASDLVRHVVSESTELQTSGNIPDQSVDAMLAAKGLRLTKRLENVSFLENCVFRGEIVPHLAIQSARGPVTVIVIVNETVPAPRRFDEGGYHGILMPAPRGSLAVLATDTKFAESVADKISSSIAWN